MTDGKVPTGKKPLRVIGVVAHLQRQPRPLGAYKREVLGEHSVAADIQTRYTCAIRVENYDWRDRPEIYRPGPVHIRNGLTAGKGLTTQVCCDPQVPGNIT